MTMAVTWDMATLLHIIESGFPQFRHELPAALREYHQFRDHLYTVDGVILYKHRIVIPPSLLTLLTSLQYYTPHTRVLPP